MKLRFWMIVFLLGAAFSLQGQDLKNALEKMQEALSKGKTMYVQMAVEVYEDSKDKFPFYKDIFQVRKSGEDYHYDYTSNALLMNSKYLLMVDKTNRQIMLAQRNKEGLSAMGNLSAFNIDSILSFYEKPTLIGVKDGQAHYRVLQKRGPVKQVDLYMDQQKGLLSRMSYLYENRQYVDIQFLKFELDMPLGKDAFNENKYIKKEKGEWVGAGEYKAFDIILQ